MPAPAVHPRVLLLDEITSALDPELVGGGLAVVREVAAQARSRPFLARVTDAGRLWSGSCAQRPGGSAGPRPPALVLLATLIAA